MGVVANERHRERGGGGGELDHPVVRAERDTAVPAAQSFRSEAPARDTLEFVRENAGLREDHPSQRRWSPRSRPYCESTSTQSGFAPVQGTALYYEMAGDGPPVILMHPGQAGLVLCERQFLPFARSYRVIRYDARGFGRSERPDEVFSHYLERSIRGSRRVVIEDAAHLVNVERPDEFARVVLDFLNTVTDT